MLGKILDKASLMYRIKYKERLNWSKTSLIKL